MIFKRLFAFILDLLIISTIISLLFLPTYEIKSIVLVELYSALMLTLLLCKDCINGQSIGKRIMKIQVVDENSNQRVSNSREILRNIFVVFWIVEVIVLFISKDKRIGDYVAKTKVIECNKIEKFQLDKNTLCAILLCFCITFALIFLMFSLIHSPMAQLLFTK